MAFIYTVTLSMFALSGLQDKLCFYFICLVNVKLKEKSEDNKVANCLYLLEL